MRKIIKRTFLLMLLFVILLSGMIGYAYFIEPNLLRVKRLTIESEYFNIIASHEPVISEFIENSSDNLLLSGHTHGGQVTIPFVTSKLLPRGSGAFRKGYYPAEEIASATPLQMYVSSGIGMTRYPIRFLNIPEIVAVTILQVN